MIQRVLFILLMSLSSLSFCSSALDHGEVVFQEYCAGCHTLKYLQYDKVGAQFSKNALTLTDATHWFSRMPPDLSLVAKTRGKTWLYAYLTSFYVDEHQRYGDNNRQLPNVLMPDPFVSLRHELSPDALDSLLSDLIFFLDYAADPSVVVRHRLGIWVLMYLVVFGAILY